MLRFHLRGRGIADPLVLKAMTKIPREDFLPPELRHLAYFDGPLEIGEGQTISQPYIVAYMTEALCLDVHSKVLEIGTGSGYQSAVLAEIAKEVYSVEIRESLSLRAQKTLKALAYANIFFKIGDGHEGWREKAPFDAIIVTAAPETLPQALLDQLKIGGRLVIPVGRRGETQILRVLVKTEKAFIEKENLPVRFVPMTGGLGDSVL